MATQQSACTVRPAIAADAGALLALMKQLAVFEAYADRFRVTEQDLLQRGLAAAGEPQFNAFVAQAGSGGLCGFAVVQELAFTYDLRPTLVLKELFVAEAARAGGVGAQLMEAVLGHARSRGCGRLKWDVLPGNEPARAFYRRFGAAPDTAWEAWLLAL